MIVIPHINNAKQYRTITSSNTYSVVYIFSMGCPACLNMSPSIQNMANKYRLSQHIKFYKIDIALVDLRGLSDIISNELKNEWIPETLIFCNSEIVARTGFRRRKNFEEWLLYHTSVDGSVNVKSCTLEVAEPDDKNDHSPLVIVNNYQDAKQYVEDSMKPSFVTLGLPGTPYHQSLKLLLQHIAHSKAEDAVFVLVTLDDSNDSELIENYFLRYRPCSLMHDQDFEQIIFTCRFDEGKLTDHFMTWADDCLSALRVLRSIGSTWDEVDESAIDAIDITEISSTGSLYDEITKNSGILVVLCRDDSPQSIAMINLHHATAAILHTQIQKNNVKLCYINFDDYDAFVEPLNLDAGPTAIVYRCAIPVAEMKGAIELKDYKAWLESIFADSKNVRRPLFSDSYSKSLSSLQSLSVSDVSSADRPTSRVSNASRWTDDERRQGRLRCEGEHEDRSRRRGLARLLMSPKPFFDRESGCVIVPSDAHEGLQLGRASAGGSYFNVTLRLSPDNPLEIHFGVSFSTDKTVDLRARFESATLTINFGYDDKEGNSHPLKLREVLPKDKKGEESTVHVGKGSEAALNLGVGYSAASVTAEGKRSSNVSFDRKTVERVKGSGDLTSRAHWTFEEDGGEAGKHGLNNDYKLSVILSDTPLPLGEIWMKFWGKAILWLPRSKDKLKLGSYEDPYKRVLPLDIDSIDV